MDRNKNGRQTSRYSPTTSKQRSSKSNKSNHTSNRKSRSRSRSPPKSSRHTQQTRKSKQQHSPRPRSRPSRRRRSSSSSYSSSSSNGHSSSSKSGSGSSSYSSTSNSSSPYSSYQSGGSSSKGGGSSSSSRSSSASSHKQSTAADKKSKNSPRHVSSRKQNDAKANPTQQPKLSIHVNNLTRNILKAHVEEIFLEYGAIQTIDFPIDEMRHFTQGHAYIKYTQEQSVEKAIKYMNGGWIDGQEVTVQVSKSNTSTSKKIRSSPKLMPSRNT